MLMHVLMKMVHYLEALHLVINEKVHLEIISFKIRAGFWRRIPLFLLSIHNIEVQQFRM